jgi:hypothetical protein
MSKIQTTDENASFQFELLRSEDTIQAVFDDTNGFLLVIYAVR